MLPLHPIQMEICKSQMMGVKGIIRDMVESDISQVLEVDNLCFCPELVEDELSCYLIDGLMKVLVVNDKVVGFHIYKLEKDKLQSYRLGIHPDYRRRGYGSKMVKEAYRKLTAVRNKIVCMIGEYSDDPIKFLKNQGFKATGVKRGECIDGSDGYCFELVLQESIVK